MTASSHECVSLQGVGVANQQHVDSREQESSCTRVFYRVISVLLAFAMICMFMMVFLRVPGGAWLSLSLASVCLCCVFVCLAIVILLQCPEPLSLGSKTLSCSRDSLKYL
ncbi:hypothetical protein [Chlamydia pecorum]|uniref:hypothetical protein n=1 Tax=Chlamydia pecorum TaxID=85991 RepID=UPI00388D212E